MPGEQPIIFATTADAVMPAVELLEIRSLDADGTVREHGTNLQATRQVAAFQAAPALGDALLFGLSDAAPSCAVALRLACQVEGLGVDPDAPPLLWEAWDGTTWAPCDVDRDDTGGLNKSGDVVLHLPPTHSTHLVGGLRAGWLRARVIEPPFGRTPYTTTPTLSAATAYVIGATVEAVHAERVPTEPLGESEGVAGQRFSTSRTPVLDAGDGLVLEVGGSDGWVAWERVPDFADSEPADRHFVLDGTTGLVELGPQIRWPDGSVRQYGAIPPHGAPLRLRSYLTGGGAAGNVRAHAIEVLRTSIPYVSRVDNRRPARGGQDAEDLPNVRLRGAQMLRSNGRCVTAEDYEHVARSAAPELARVRCVPAAAEWTTQAQRSGAEESTTMSSGGDGADANAVRLLVVPAMSVDAGRVPFDALRPSDESLQRVAEAVDGRRVLGARVLVEPPVYQGVTVVTKVRPRPGVAAEQVEEECRAALYRFLNPVGGGPEGEGWPFGRPVQYGEIFAVLQRVPDVDIVDDVRLFPADPVTGQRGEPTQRIELAPNALVFSFDHQVRVTT